MRSLTAALLAVALVVTSLSAGMARGQATPVGVVEVCQGLTIVSVEVDGEGNPVRHVHLCPDGVMSLVAPLAVADFDVPIAYWMPVTPVIETGGRGSVDAPQGVARGPPFTL
ncbi:hypothetical protein [Sagittula salina]|uniref:hypothetical protein n=1 Tax=Sagittula salina TaxID=2820268 RepID=UPI001AE08C73|nr:hypothetical protein [Sagittula salina]